MNFLAQELVDEYIDETCAESDECWTQICNPRTMKKLIKSKFYPMSILFDEILQFRAYIPEKHASTKINVTYTGKRFRVSTIDSGNHQEHAGLTESTVNHRKRKAEDSETSEWDEDESSSDTDTDVKSSSSAGGSPEKGDFGEK
ncbi:hypothetical protein TWF706_010345 [Orbilia oligospora]|nr:hypothetical protein TWF706_010345 [Orbilia oligospora]